MGFVKRKQVNLRYLLYVNFISLIGFYVYAPLYALFAQSLEINPQTIAYVWSGYSGLLALSVLFFGKLENRRSKGRMLVLGYFGCAVGALLFLAVQNQTSLMLVLAFNALASGMTLPAYKTLFAKNEARGRESEQWSWLDAGTMFSAAVGSALGGLIIAQYGFEGIFIAMAVLQLAAAVIAYKAIYALR